MTAATEPMQCELALLGTIVPQGMVVLMRLEDWMRVRPPAPLVDAALVPVPAVPLAPSARRPDSVEDLVLSWLRGEAASASYDADTLRMTDGRVIATSTGAIVTACRLHYLSTSELQRRRRVGKILQRHGWVRRYVMGSQGVRERRYYAPPLWMQE